MENKDIKLILKCDRENNGGTIALLEGKNDYIVAWGYNALNNTWNQGHYFNKADDYKIGNALSNALNKFNEYFDDRINVINNFENMGISHEDIEAIRELVHDNSNKLSLDGINNIGYLHRLHKDNLEYIHNQGHNDDLEVKDIKSKVVFQNKGVHYDTLLDYLKDNSGIDVSDKTYDFLLNCDYIDTNNINFIHDDYAVFCNDFFALVPLVSLPTDTKNCVADFSGFIENNFDIFKDFANKNWDKHNYEDRDDFVYEMLNELERYCNGYASDSLYKLFDKEVFKKIEQNNSKNKTKGKEM